MAPLKAFQAPYPDTRHSPGIPDAGPGNGTTPPATTTAPPPPATDPVAVARICANAVATADLDCENSILWAVNTTATASCHKCVAPGTEACPAGHGGTDCSQCRNANACPPLHLENGTTLAAVGCSSHTIAPSQEELWGIPGAILPGRGLASGPRRPYKDLTCRCGGVPSDESTAYVCGMSTGDLGEEFNWQFKVHPRGEQDPGEVDIWVRARAPMPSQDAEPDCTDEEREQGTCPTRERYRFAYPQWWEGNLTRCAWGAAACTGQLEHADASGAGCILYQCAESSIQCPAGGVERCPGFRTVPPYCDNPAGEADKYWQRNCNPILLPQSGLPANLQCLATPAPGGRFQCYFDQEGGYLASLGLQCSTGACLYDGGGPTPTPGPGGAGRASFGEGACLAVLGGLMLALLVVAHGLVRRDAARSRALCRAALGDDVDDDGPAQPQRVSQDEHGASASEEAARRAGYAPVTSDGLGRVRPGRQAGRSSAHVRWGAVLTWTDVTYHVFDAAGRARAVLRGVTGVAGPEALTAPLADGRAGPTAVEAAGRRGCLLAVMGPSGAGKTSLLDVLAGRRPECCVGGEITVNGRVASPSALRRVTGYVLQDDVLHGTSTAFEFLMFHAELRLPGKSREERVGRVLGVLSELGLTRVAHSVVGDELVRGLSGGERRRLSIAAELLASPGLLLLDEPTSGLDSTNAARVVRLAAWLARRGTTIVMSIHQPRPDLLRLMDRLVLLSSRGQCVYSGSMDRASAILEAAGRPAPDAGVNIADHLLDLMIELPEAEVDAMVATFEQSDAHAENMRVALALEHEPLGVPHPRKRAPLSAQLRALCVRNLRATYRHPFAVKVNLVATAAMALALALAFWGTGTDTAGIQNRFGVLYFILLFLSLMSMSALPIWRASKTLMLKESSGGVYSPFAWVAAALASDVLPMRLLPPVLFAVVSYLPIGLHPGSAGALLTFTASLVLSSGAASSLAMAVGAAADSGAVANLVGSLIVMSFLLFGGFLLNRDLVPDSLRWVATASYFTYAYEALAANEFHGSPLDFTFTTPLNSTRLPPLRVSGDGVLQEFGFDARRIPTDLVALVALSVGMIALALLILAVRAAAAGQRVANWLHPEQAALALGRDVHGLTWTAAGAAQGEPPGAEEVVESADDVRHAAGDVARGTHPWSHHIRRHASEHGAASALRLVASYLHRGVAAIIKSPSALVRAVAMSAQDRDPTRPAGVPPHDAGLYQQLIAPDERDSDPTEDGDVDTDGEEPAAPPRRRTSDVEESHSEVSLQHGINGARAAPARPQDDEGGAGASGADVAIDLEPGRAAAQREIVPATREELAARERGAAAERASEGGDSAARLSWEGIEYRVPLPGGGGTRLVLRGLTGWAGPPVGGGCGKRGCLAAILGPSGAGKTSLLDILAGRKDPARVRGVVRLGGYVAPPAALARRMGYVPQSDVLPATATVLEHLVFHAELRLPASLGRREKVDRAWRLITELGLSKVAHSVVGDELVRGLSGGERRRLSIAAELLASPGLLLLDEPTSGLDSTNAARVVKLADALARRGTTIVMSIHQPRPDLLRLMDRLVLLSSRGQCVYSGAVDDAQDFLSACGRPPPPPGIAIADHLLDLAVNLPQQEMDDIVTFRAATAAAAKEREVATAPPVPGSVPSRKGRAPLRTQLRELSLRTVRAWMRHPLYVGVHVASALFVAGALAAVYADTGYDTGGIQNRLGLLFFMLLYMALVSLSSLPLWSDARALFRRERAAGAYGTAAYFASVAVLDLLSVRVAPALFLAWITGPTAALRPGASHRNGMFLVLALANAAASGLNMAIGAAIEDTAVANMAGCIAALLGVLLGGFLLSLRDASLLLRLPSVLSYARPAFEALLSNEFHGADGFRFTAHVRPGVPADDVPHVDVTGDEVLETLGFRPGFFARGLVALVMQIGGVMAASYVLLRARGRTQG